MTSFSHSSAVKAASALLLATALGCGPGDGSKEFDKGLAAFRAGDLLRADRFFTRAIEIAPGNVDALVAETRVKLATGDIESAAGFATRAADLAADDPDVISLVAETAWHRKDYDLAQKSYLRLAEGDGFDAATRSVGWTGYGIVENARERGEASCHLARCAFLRAIRLDRKNASAWYHLGLLYRDGFGYVDAALEQFLFYVRLAEKADARVQRVQDVMIGQLREQIAQRRSSVKGASSRNSAAAAAALVRATEAAKKKQAKAAKAAYAEAYVADPLSYPAALGLATCWEKEGTKAALDEALRYYRAACELNPSACRTFLTTAALATKLGRTASAADLYSRAVAANPTDITAIDGLIRALGKTGKDRESARAYQSYRDSLGVRKPKK